MLFMDLKKQIERTESWLYTAWFNFLIRYRKAILGPALLLVGPGLFIAILGPLFSEISNISPSVFIPHLTIGLIVWTLISGFVSGSTTVFPRNRPQILQGGTSLAEIAMVEALITVLQFLHQMIIVVAIFVIFGLGIEFYSLVSIIGLSLLIANGIWVTIVFGIIGARYHDLTEVIQAVLRIAFLATPIIWMPGTGERGSVMGAFLTLNPFYHFVELVRAPMLGDAISPLTWVVALSITVLGFVFAHFMYDRFARQVPLWV